MLPISHPQPDTQSKSEHSQFMNYLVKYVAKIIAHLYDRTGHSGNFDKTVRVLLIDDMIADIELLTSNLNHTLNSLSNIKVLGGIQIETTHISSSVFLLKPYDMRYDLGIFIHPSLMSSAVPLKNSVNGSEKNLQNIRMIATRLRDLFAQQSVLFMPHYQNDIVFNELGYMLSSNDQLSETQINCWQFNIFDYKHKPDWLNSRYWANPENYDKYRW